MSSAPQGRGHQTTVAQVVAEVLGVALESIVVNVELDTQKDAWSIASGNYSSRFAGAVAGAVYKAALKIRDRLAAIAAEQLQASPEDIRFAGGKILWSMAGRWRHSIGLPVRPAGRRACCRKVKVAACAKPPSGARRNWWHRTTRIRSIARCATALSSASVVWKSTV